MKFDFISFLPFYIFKLLVLQTDTLGPLAVETKNDIFFGQERDKNKWFLKNIITDPWFLGLIEKQW